MPSVANRFTITDVLNALQANRPNLLPGTLYTLQDLVGNAVWHSMPTGTRKHLGQEFKSLTKGGGLPVKWVDWKSDNSNVYQLK